MDIRCSRNLSTFDLETEVFLHVINNCADYVHSPEHDFATAASGVDAALAVSFATVTTADVTAPGGGLGHGRGRWALSR